LERGSVGAALDLDLLSPFLKKIQQIVGGSREGSSFSRSTMEERK
jgi:hypothetical protein